jgi:hypothetical protein
MRRNYLIFLSMFARFQCTFEFINTVKYPLTLVVKCHNQSRSSFSCALYRLKCREFSVKSFRILNIF